MQVLKDLLEATIKYQDVMDDVLTDVHASNLQFKMLDLFDEAYKTYPATMSKYNFEFKKDRQQEFDSLQKFITEISRLLKFQ